MKKTRQMYLRSALAMFICIVMLVGSTFAWFTDSVSSMQNIITAGNLDLEMYWTDDLDSGVWYNVEEDGHNTIFNYDNWEPGYTDVRYVKLVNAGSLALNYKLTLTPENGVGKLAEVINVYFAKGGVAVNSRADLVNLRAIGLLDNVLNGGATADGTLLAEDQYSPLHPSGEVVMTIAMNMLTSAGNEYMNEDAGEFSITALATQAPFEKDSFGSDYDSDAEYPAIINGTSVKVPVTPVDGKIPAGGVTLSKDGVSAFVPEGALVKDGATALEFTVTPLENTTSDITVVNNEILIPVDVHIEGLAEDNTVPAIIDLGEVLPKYLNMGNYRIFHVEDGTNKEMTLVDDASALTEHNRFTYDTLTGKVVVAMATFSEVALVADTEAKWEGNADYTWYNADATALQIANADQLYAFAKIVGGMANGYEADSFKGKTVTLLSDINLNGGKATVDNKTKVFYPIGYYNNKLGIYDRNDAEVEGMTGVTSSVSSFEGTFDGNGHTIANFYQNTWEMFGDYNSGYSGTPNYYKDAMGLFGYVLNGTVKNLTVDNFSSDGEFTPTGVIAAYSDGNSTFENIAITHCNPRVYNTGNGGIIGIAGDTSATNDDHITLKNITVDNTNKITALWGSYDVACGGLVGMYRGNVDGSGNATGDTLSFENCHVAAKMDVYNDVCGNYQYYAYRYAGMIIGSVRHNTTNDEGKTIPAMTGISATGCTVNYGDWNDYYYCEFKKNGHPSYSGPDDYKFSRVPNSEIDISKGKENATCIGHNHSDVEDNQAIYLPFHQLFTGYGWGVNSIGLEKYSGIVTNLDITEGDQEESVEKFTANIIKNVSNKVTIKASTLFTLKNDSKVALKYDSLIMSVVDNDASDGIITGTFNKPENGTWEDCTITLTGTGKATITIQDYYFCTPTTIEVTVTDRQPEEKFEVVMNNGDFLHRVGNNGTVALDKLFKAKENVTVGTVSVTVEAVNGTSASGTYSNNAIQFSGTGVVKVTITDNDYCTPTELYLEVVDAVNATSATNATKNNVVLLNDCGFGSLEVLGGYTLYGNGFTMTCGSDSAALDMGYSFVTLNSGTLDNVQVVCPNFDYAVLYKSNMTESGNRSETTDKTRYFNVKSGVMVSGNSRILNSRISGGRAAVNVTGGNVLIDNSRVELGAVASLLVGAANSLTLRDVTLVQKPTASTYDSNKKLMGFSVLYMCDSEGKATSTTLEGTLVQQAWVKADDKQYVPSAGQDIVDGVMKETAFIHNIDGKDSLNLGFAYMPEEIQKTVNAPDNITDNRTDKATIPYEMKDVKIQISILSTTVYVYSYKNTNGTADSFKTESEYKPNKYGDIITVSYSDTADGLESSKSFSTDGWVHELNVDLDKASGYKLDFSKLSMTVNGASVTDYKVNGSTKPTSPVAVTAGGTSYTLTATIDGKEYTATFKVTGTETSKESPSLVAANYEAGLCVASSYGGTWHGAAPALQGIQIKYWSVAEKQYKTINLSDYTPTTKGQLNGTNTTWTYSPANGDFTLTLTGGQVHSGNKVYAMPVVCNGKLYFVASKSNGLVNSGNSARTIPVTYTFKDNNGGDELTFSHTWSVAENKDAQYSYSDFCNGTLTKLEKSNGGSSTCVTPDTLITLADGSQKCVDSLTGDEMLLVWNLETGKYEAAPIVFVDSEEETEYEIVHLYFSDKSDVKVIGEHGFFDIDLAKYVYIDAQNYADYVGHRFVKEGNVAKNKWEIITLDKVVIEKEVTTAWSPVTFEHLCYYTNGVLSMPGGIDGLFNIFEVDTDTMRYDEEKMQKDIETYGLFTVEDFGGLIPEIAFEAFNGDYLKVAIGKGLLTWEDIAYMAERYIPLM